MNPPLRTANWSLGEEGYESAREGLRWFAFFRHVRIPGGGSENVMRGRFGSYAGRDYF